MASQIACHPVVRDHLVCLTAAQRSLIAHSVDEQLINQPTVETRNRKRLRANDFAGWELRVRDLRVYYEVEEEAQLVRIRAVGVKVRERVYVANQEFIP